MGRPYDDIQRVILTIAREMIIIYRWAKGGQIMFGLMAPQPFSGADKSRFWPNRALWGTSMKLGTIMV